MKAMEVASTDRGYQCDNCEEWYSEKDFDTLTVLYEPVLVSDRYEHGCCDNYIVAETGTEEKAWVCGGGCFHHDEGEAPTITAMPVDWRCGVCETTYYVDDYDSEEEAKQDAINCCKEEEE